ncbi:MAG TPA: hypothetical protein VNK24_09540 [Elusimicrobiota bacterium]|nr:hypothetical protein [Elusimicrobiota bacterium]
MDGSLPTDAELYLWIGLGKTPAAHSGFQSGQIECCRAYWNELKEFSEKRGLLEKNFIGKTEATFHASFWELYLPKAFDAAGIPLSRGRKGQPDFYFEKDGRKGKLQEEKARYVIALNGRRALNGHPHDSIQDPHAEDASNIFKSMPIWRLDLRTGSVSRSTPQEHSRAK